MAPIAARLVFAGAALLAACGGAPTPGPCGPCASGASAGLEHVAAPRSAKVEQLAKRRVEQLRELLAQLRTSFEHGATGLDELFAALRDVAFAARDSGFHGEELRSILTDYRDAVAALRDLTRERASRGAVGEGAVQRVEVLLAEAEYWLGEATEHH